jgi:hypothetical protein
LAPVEQQRVLDVVILLLAVDHHPLFARPDAHGFEVHGDGLLVVDQVGGLAGVQASLHDVHESAGLAGPA